MAIKMNYIQLTGRVSWKDIKTTDNGNVLTTICLGVKRNSEKWDNFFIKFFNTKMGIVAEEVAEFVNTGDYIQITGRLIESSFIPKGWENQLDENGNQKTVSRIEIVGKSYKKVYYNEENECYEYIEAKNGKNN